MAETFLCRPTAAFTDSYLAALHEGFIAGGAPPLAEAEISAIAADFAAHLRRLDRDGQERHVHAGRDLASVPSNVFWLVDGRDFLGSVSIRARIDTTILTHFGGHIGYGVRPSARRQGHGTRQLTLALDVCRGMGIGLVRISCATDNFGSRRIIEANGGLLLRQCEPDWYIDRQFLLFEIPLV